MGENIKRKIIFIAFISFLIGLLIGVLVARKETTDTKEATESSL